MSDMTSPAPASVDSGPAAAAWWRHPRWPLVGVLALALAHLVWVGTHLAPAIMSPDANGYVVQARLIAETGRTWFSPTSPAQFVGAHWLETTDGVFHSRYPAGLPMLMAGLWKLGGLGALVWVNPVLASATLLFVFFLARRLTGGWTALLAAAVVATVPVTNHHALDADAHVAAAFFLVAGVLALLRFGETPTVPLGLMTGVLLGIVPTIRYPEAITGVTIAVWLLWRVRPLVRVWPAVVGAALPIGVLCLHNAAAYGAFWRTGYALTHEQTGFGVGYFMEHALPYLEALGGQGPALFFGIGAAGMAALAVERRTRAEGLLFAGLVVPLVLLYMAYYFGGGAGMAAGYLRFLVPIFPFFAVAGAWLLGRMADKLGVAGRAALGAVAVLQLIVGFGASAQMLAQSKTSLTAAAGVRLLAEKEVPAGSVVIVDRQLAESLDAAGEWKLVEENLVTLGGGPRGLGRGGPGGGPGGMMRGPGGGGFGFSPPGVPDNPEADSEQPSPQQIGKNRAQQARYAGLSVPQRRTQVWADLAAWADGRPVYWLARSIDTVDNSLPAGAEHRSVAEIDAPVAMGPGGGGGPGARPMLGGGPVRAGGAMPGGNFGPPGPGGARGAAAGRRGQAIGDASTKLHFLRVDLPKPPAEKRLTGQVRAAAGAQ
jgi:4-amino-4-deoxy-L-arabinose transferase-like glycosyltransferase